MNSKNAKEISAKAHYICLLCEYTFLNKKTLYEHLRKEHSDEELRVV